MQDFLVPSAVGARLQYEDRAGVSASGVSRAVEIAGFVADQRGLGKRTVRSTRKGVKCLFCPRSVRLRDKFEYVIGSSVEIAGTVKEQAPDRAGLPIGSGEGIDDFFRPGTVRLWRQSKDYAVVMRTAVASHAVDAAYTVKN